MKLKKIEILGFKSFADKTIIEFTHPITAIVGPNGCGKSNIADAFRWVLFGEQSAKAMRGSKMADVIFAGTSQRQPLNFAEVTITFSNYEKLLPIEYEEVSVTRRLYRNGESDYLINRHPVRLKDVQNLFLDSGVGKDAYAIFEQGKLDQIIQYSPLERRYIFEEAAGILRFLQNKREALRKLEQVEANASRVRDIHQEVGHRIIVLEQQAEKAKAFKESKLELDSLEKLLLVLQWNSFEQKISGCKNKEIEQQEKLSFQTAFLQEAEKKIEKIHQTLDDEEKEQKEKNQKYYRLIAEKEAKIREKSHSQEMGNEAFNKIKKWEQELEIVKKKEIQRQAEALSGKEKIQELEHSLVDKGMHLHSNRENTKTLEEIVFSLREEQQRLQHERLKTLNAKNQFEIEIKQNGVRMDALQEKKTNLHLRQSKLSQQSVDLQKNFKEKQSELQTFIFSLQEQKTQFASLEKSLEFTQRSIQEERKKSDATLSELTELKARQKILTRLKEEGEGLSSGGKKILQESKQEKSPLHNIVKALHEYIVPISGKEKAMALALRPYTQTLVVQTLKDLQTTLEYTEKHQIKDLSILCVEKMKPNASHKLKNSLSGSAQIHPVAQHLLSDVCLSESIESAFGMPASSVVLNAGLFVDAHQVLFFSQVSEQNIFLREAELKKIQVSLAELEKQYSTLTTNINQMVKVRENTEAEKAALDKALRKDELKQVEINYTLQRLKNDLEKSQKEEKFLLEESTTIEENFTKITTLLSEFMLQHSAAKEKEAQIQQKYESINKELDDKASQLKLEKEMLGEKELTYRKLSEEKRKWEHSLHIFEIQDRESADQKKKLQEEVILSKELQTKAKNSENLITIALQELEEKIEVAKQEHSLIETKILETKQFIKIQEKELQGIRENFYKIEEEKQRNTLLIEQHQLSLQNIQNILQERFQTDIESAKKQTKDQQNSHTSIDTVEKKLRLSRRAIENFGDINMTSIEEHEQSKERHQFLSQQLEDLSSSKQELTKVISELDSESRKLFSTTFEGIRENFKKNFKILFNGGEADLLFTEENDILEAGIDIIAKPPGKQMRSITLLSGGEKCLTALALLFSIFEIKPAPFCILDEIDAPLDDTNVERFLSVVKHFVDRCQFIIITHNKRTMSIADILCGISMEERGVSKLLTLEFATAQT